MITVNSNSHSDSAVKVVPCVNQCALRGTAHRPAPSRTDITCWRMASVNDSNWSILALAGSEQVTTLLASSSAKSYSIFKQLVTIGNFPFEYQLLHLY